VILFAASEHWTLDLPELQEVYESIAAAGMTAMLHPGADQFVRLPVRSDWNLGINLGAVFESSTAVARLMLSGMLDRVPDLTLVIPHLGGVLPYLAQRSIDQSGSGAAQHDMLHYLRERCLLDSCSYYPPALTCAIETVTADRVLLGTDYPYRGSIIRGIEDIARSELAEDVKDAILAGNAQRVGLAVPS
jgi:aminocarboxymuconate-semialdehyde decarboxylase